jgi:DNA-directed RNA polymerase subunit RPC12/RpoP
MKEMSDKCSLCGKKFAVIVPIENGLVMKCLDCGFMQPYKNRRKKDQEIDFEDRRKLLEGGY